MMRRKSRRGATTIEMTLVGIPIIFILISVFEISRGMWNYHTLTYATKLGVRYATVHGADCSGEPFNNTCSVTIQNIVKNVIQPAAVGLDLDNTKLTFCTGFCSSGGGTTCSLSGSDCPGTTWPPANFNSAGQVIEIIGVTPFNSALAMFWPGSTPVSFSAVKFSAGSSDVIQY